MTDPSGLPLCRNTKQIIFCLVEVTLVHHSAECGMHNALFSINPMCKIHLTYECRRRVASTRQKLWFVFFYKAVDPMGHCFDLNVHRNLGWSNG
jgi:hypothetical protein